MFYSHSIQEAKLDLFSLFLNRLIEGDDRYKPIVDNILLEARDYAKGDKDIYAIDRDNFALIMLLNSRDTNLVSSLSQESLDNEIYKKVLELLSRNQVPE